MENMERLNLSGEILFGTGKIGGVLEEGISFRLMELYGDLGGRVIDTGHCYGMFPPNVGRQPRSERTIGKFLKRSAKKDWILCTKGGYPDIDTRASRLSQKDLSEDLDASLREMGIDCIDVYYLHRDDASLPVSEIMPVVDGFVRAGKIRWAGASNWSPERVLEANTFAEENGLTPFGYVQNLRNLGPYCAWPMNDQTMRITSRRDIDIFRQIPGLQFVAYSSQAYGYFSKANPADPAAAMKLLRERYAFFDPERSLKRLERAWELANAHNVRPSAVVLAYVLSDVDHPAAVIGCTREEQLREAMACRDFRLTEDELVYLENA